MAADVLAFGEGYGMRKLRVLVACEMSGRVRDAFRARGHDAWSCDLKPSEVPGPHLQCDVLEVLNHGWDLMIAHPPCTYLAVSGIHWTTRGFRPLEKTREAIRFVQVLWDAPVKHVAIENPVSILSTSWRPPDCIVHPWMFGDSASKATCFWIRNLPKLKPTCIVPPRGWIYINGLDPKPPPRFRLHISSKYGVLFGCFLRPGETPPPMRWDNQRPDGNPLARDPVARARTWPGIAEAMASQWGEFCSRWISKNEERSSGTVNSLRHKKPLGAGVKGVVEEALGVS